MMIFVVAVVLIGGGAGYYFKIYRPKQQQADIEDDYGADEADPYGEDEQDAEDHTAIRGTIQNLSEKTVLSDYSRRIVDGLTAQNAATATAQESRERNCRYDRRGRFPVTDRPDFRASG